MLLIKIVFDPVFPLLGIYPTETIPQVCKERHHVICNITTWISTRRDGETNHRCVQWILNRYLKDWRRVIWQIDNMQKKFSFYKIMCLNLHILIFKRTYTYMLLYTVWKKQKEYVWDQWVILGEMVNWNLINELLLSCMFCNFWTWITLYYYNKK